MHKHGLYVDVLNFLVYFMIYSIILKKDYRKHLLPYIVDNNILLPLWWGNAKKLCIMFMTSIRNSKLGMEFKSRTSGLFLDVLNK